MADGSSNVSKPLAHCSFLWGVGAVAVVALVLAAISWRRSPTITGSDNRSRVLTSIAKEKVLRVGYGGFPPYTLIDPKEADASKRVKGFSVDLVEEIARLHVPPLRVEWHNFNWDTLKADMESGKFDFIADPVFQTVPRAMDFGLCEPYSYFGIAVAVVRLDEVRFRVFSDLDRDDITIALAEGWTSSEYARKNLTKPKFKSVTVAGDAFTQLDDVLLGRADVALNDVPTVVQYVRAHSGKVKALWLENPPSMVPGSFLLRREDVELGEFLNASLRIVQANGTIKRLDAKWRTYGYFPDLGLHRGEGLTQQPATAPSATTR